MPCVVVARRGDRLRALADRYEGFEVLEADLQTDAGIARVADRLASTINPVDLLVNNAGFGTSGPFHESGIERATGQVDLNVKALVALTHGAVNAFRRHGGGHVLNVSSVASFQASPNMAVYAATKSFVTSFTEAVHEENRTFGVKVSALCPGFVATEFQAVSGGADRMTRTPRFLWLNADKVARAGLDGVAKNRAIVVPGWQYAALPMLSKLTPRLVLRRIAAKIL
uniref:Putative oxidoreductase n=1 Tax=uncultured bacterium CBNPD1 BAC clone 2089 TaxID=417311 RepID=B1N6Q8_9BACT|nr:putative oxidoreductase [uncultured bacterium CBNPD1 BAC clone 2089]